MISEGIPGGLVPGCSWLGAGSVGVGSESADKGTDAAEFCGVRTRVLLVNREKDYTEILRKRMGIRAIDLEGAFSGNEAIQLLREQDFDVAVLDPKLGDMDGLQLLKLLKTMDPRLPVIMLTTQDLGAASVDRTPREAFASLMKPCDLEDLLEKIREAAKARRDTS